MRSSVLFFLPGFAIGNPLLGNFLSPRDCAADNCIRALRASAFTTRSGTADCSSYLLATVTPATSTITQTVTLTSTPTVTSTEDVSTTLSEVVSSNVDVSTTLSEVDTSTEDVQTTVPATVTSTEEVQTTISTTVISDKTIVTTLVATVTSNEVVYKTVPSTLTSNVHVTVTEPVTVITTTHTTITTTSTLTTLSYIPNPNAKRQETVIPTNIPAYASPCSGAVRYSSACSCLGVLPSTITVATPLTTTTISVTVTSPSTQIILSTDTLTSISTDIITSTDTLTSVSTDIIVDVSTATTTSTDIVLQTNTATSIITDIVLKTDTSFSTSTQIDIQTDTVTSTVTDRVSQTATVITTTTIGSTITSTITHTATAQATAFSLQASSGAYDGSIAYIVYVNDGDADFPSPVYQLEFSTDGELGVWQMTASSGSNLWSQNRDGQTLNQYAGGPSSTSEVTDDVTASNEDLAPLVCDFDQATLEVTCVGPAGSSYNTWCESSGNIFLCSSSDESNPFTFVASLIV